MMTQNEVVGKEYQALVNTLGVIDAIRFLQYFSHGSGNYTQDRHQWLQERSLETVLTEMQSWKETDVLTDFEEVIE